jgi:bifunctional non-homologous end joining protein LigD
MRYQKIEGEKFRSFIKPMLAELTDQPAFDNPDWVFEIKWDGYRAIAETGKDRRLYSRNGLSFQKAYPIVFKALAAIKKELILDGEIVVFDEHNKPSFQMLQNYSNSSGVPICYYVFDCLYADGKDLTRLTLLERKEILQRVLPRNNSVVLYCDHVTESGVEFFNQIQKSELEGMIAKKADSRYYKGKRTSSWLKIKNVKSEEAIIIGYTPPKGQRTGFGSLLLGQYHRGKLTYIGNVGTGFTDKLLRDLFSKFQKLKTKEAPLTKPPKVTAGTIWIEPVLVCNLKYTEKTTDGIVRHPVFQGLRIDKSPTEVKSNQ